MNDRREFPNASDDRHAGGPALIAAASARRFRRVRQARNALLIGGTLAVMVFALLRPAPPPVDGLAAVPATPALELISDEELLRLVNDRTVVAIGEPDGSNTFLLPKSEE